jgi:hypothetical protein
MNLKDTSRRLTRPTAPSDIQTTGIRSLFNRQTSFSAPNRRTLRFNAQTQQFGRDQGEENTQRSKLVSFHNYMPISELFEFTMECL